MAEEVINKKQRVLLMYKLSDGSISIRDFITAAKTYAKENNLSDKKITASEKSIKELVNNGILGNQEGVKPKDIDLGSIKWSEFANNDVFSPQKALAYDIEPNTNKVKPRYFRNRNFIDTNLSKLENYTRLFFDRNITNYPSLFEDLPSYPFNVTEKGEVVNVHRTRISGDEGIARSWGTEDSGENPIAYQSRGADKIRKFPPKADFDREFKNALNDIDPLGKNPNAQLAKRALLLSRNSVLRIGEIANLFVEDVNWETGEITGTERVNKIRKPQKLSQFALHLLKSTVFNPDGTLKDPRYDTSDPANKVTLSGEGKGGWAYSGTPIFNVNKVATPTSVLTDYLMKSVEEGGGAFGEKLSPWNTTMGTKDNPRPFRGGKDMRKAVATYTSLRYPINQRGEISVTMGRRISAIEGSIKAVDDDSYFGLVEGQGDDFTAKVNATISNDFARSYGHSHINELVPAYKIDIPELWNNETNTMVGHNSLAVPAETDIDQTNQQREMTDAEKKKHDQSVKEDIASSKVREQEFISRGIELQSENIDAQQALNQKVIESAEDASNVGKAVERGNVQQQVTEMRIASGESELDLLEEANNQIASLENSPTPLNPEDEARLTRLKSHANDLTNLIESKEAKKDIPLEQMDDAQKAKYLEANKRPWESIDDAEDRLFNNFSRSKGEIGLNSLEALEAEVQSSLDVYNPNKVGAIPSEPVTQKPLVTQTDDWLAEAAKDKWESVKPAAAAVDEVDDVPKWITDLKVDEPAPTPPATTVVDDVGDVPFDEAPAAVPEEIKEPVPDFLQEGPLIDAPKRESVWKGIAKKFAKKLPFVGGGIGAAFMLKQAFEEQAWRERNAGKASIDDLNRSKAREEYFKLASIEEAASPFPITTGDKREMDIDKEVRKELETLPEFKHIQKSLSALTEAKIGRIDLPRKERREARKKMTKQMDVLADRRTEMENIVRSAIDERNVMDLEGPIDYTKGTAGMQGGFAQRQLQI